MALPSLETTPRVSLEIAGSGIRAGRLPPDASLDDLAPTLAAAMGIERPHPEVRSGEAWVHLLGGLQKGDEVVTAGGIRGKVIKVAARATWKSQPAATGRVTSATGRCGWRR